MPRGVYPRKKSNETSTTSHQASVSGASKTKKSWKAAKTASASTAGRSTANTEGGNDRYAPFVALTTYLSSIGQIRSTQQTPNAKLEQEFEATISNLRNIRETLFAVSTEDVIGQDMNNNTRQTAQVPVAAAPVPFNPPQYTGAVQQ